jgi:hypothetical protein
VGSDSTAFFKFSPSPTIPASVSQSSVAMTDVGRLSKEKPAFLRCISFFTRLMSFFIVSYQLFKSGEAAGETDCSSSLLLSMVSNPLIKSCARLFLLQQRYEAALLVTPFFLTSVLNFCFFVFPEASLRQTLVNPAFELLAVSTSFCFNGQQKPLLNQLQFLCNRRSFYFPFESLPPKQFDRFDYALPQKLPSEKRIQGNTLGFL